VKIVKNTAECGESAATATARHENSSERERVKSIFCIVFSFSLRLFLCLFLFQRREVLNGVVKNNKNNHKEKCKLINFVYFELKTAK